MAGDSRTISGSVATSSDDSRYHIAFELAKLISHSEVDQQRDRNYWLNLYCDCYSVVSYGNRRSA
jgi:hypothetical protein